jgi:peptidoglycan-N-acetylglucosamine deacetylase
MLSVTVDVDGEAGLPDGGAGYGERLSSRSERLYGLRRGLPRILAVLEAAGAEATFYVPGITAERHPDEIAGIAAAGHELAHHGHTHRRPDTLSAAEQREELTDGLAALSRFAPAPVHGYRAPGWELTATTLAELGPLGFAYDSSLMGDDRPYRIRSGSNELVELPVHWSLDDAPHFAHTTDPSGLLAVWRRELELATDGDRLVTVTLHPDILGRPHRVDVLSRLLEHAATLGAAVVPHRVAASDCAP